MEIQIKVIKVLLDEMKEIYRNTVKVTVGVQFLLFVLILSLSVVLKPNYLEETISLPLGKCDLVVTKNHEESVFIRRKSEIWI